MAFKFDPFTGKLAFAPSSQISTYQVSQLPTTVNDGTMAYSPDASGFQKQGDNSQSLIYSKSGSWYRSGVNSKVVPDVTSIWKVGSIYNNYDPASGAFNKSVLSAVTVNGIYTEIAFIDMPINGYTIQVLTKYQIKNSLRGTASTPALIMITGWGIAYDFDVSNYVNANYAVIQYDWRGTFGGTYSYPTTPMTLYPAALSRLNQVVNPNADYTNQASVTDIASIRNQDLYYWYAMPRRVLAYVKSLTSDIDATKIGFWGLSWGGTIAWSMAIEPDIKAVVAVYGNGWIHYWKTFGVWPYNIPYTEPPFSEGNNLFISALESQAYSPYANAPVLWQCGTNDVHGQFDRGNRNFELLPVNGSFAFEANQAHSDRLTTVQNEKLWFDKYVKGQAITWPTTPSITPSLVPSGAQAGYPMVTIAPSNTSDISSVAVWYALETAYAPNRTWVSATVTNNGNGTWSAVTPCNDTSKYVFAYAFVTYTSTIAVCSKQAAYIPANLGSASPVPIVYWKPTNATSGTVNMWLDAQDAATLNLSGQLVTQWNDKSSVLNHAIAASGEEPTLTTVSGLNALQFNISKRMRSYDTVTLRDFRNVFIVANYDGGSAFTTTPRYQGLFSAANSGGSSNGNCFNADVGSPASPTITTLSSGSFLDSAFFVNGTQISANTSTRTVLPAMSSGFCILSSNATAAVSSAGYGLSTLREISNNGWYGKICEVVAFGSALTTSDRQKMEGYLAWKWNLVSQLPAAHPYKNSRPTA